jgi:hypothetical protein
MPKYVIERELPGVGGWSADQLKARHRTSCGCWTKWELRSNGCTAMLQGDKIYCVYSATNEGLVPRAREDGRVSR